MEKMHSPMHFRIVSLAPFTFVVFLHFRKNVESKLASLGVKEHKQYIDEIFGKQEKTVYEMGLLDATSEDMFDAILASLQEPWAKREKN